MNQHDRSVPLKTFEAQEKAEAKGFRPLPLTDIMAMEFEPVRWAVEGYVPEGRSILAGRQKLGKTWLALDFSIAVGMGGNAMGAIPCEQGDVLYIDMENGYRRI